MSLRFFTFVLKYSVEILFFCIYWSMPILILFQNMLISELFECEFCNFVSSKPEMMIECLFVPTSWLLIGMTFSLPFLTYMVKLSLSFPSFLLRAYARFEECLLLNGRVVCAIYQSSYFRVALIGLHVDWYFYRLHLEMHRGLISLLEDRLVRLFPDQFQMTKDWK